MQKLMAFEQGYAAFLRGMEAGDNPFDKEVCPHSFKRWGDGWNSAQRRKMEREIFR